MERKLFLISEVTANFSEICRKFVLAAGGEHARIAYLMQGDKNWQKYFDEYKEYFEKYKPASINPIFPNQSNDLTATMYSNLEKATGIFVGGGYTFRYINAYTQQQICQLILQKYNSGTIYAGLSAGAILTIRLGILPNFAIKPHFTRRNRLLELAKKVNKAKYGLGIDDGCWLEVTDETEFKIFGVGNCYFFTKKATNHFNLQICQNKDVVKL
ncbi:MAG: cyanophycinase [Candidatus Cloacimonadota bacterium]|jgi:cyanophycinase-like exopeptidase|nr:cyanophycinase [Candidatus Cloacimonadota bacterium]